MMKSLALLLLATGICAGAFGAHGLKSIVTPERLEVFKTAANYQMLMAITLFILSKEEKVRSWTLKLLLVGSLTFSLSLYALVLLDQGKFGMLTPIGGVLMIISILIASLQVIDRNCRIRD